MIYYTGVGARTTPNDVLKRMIAFATAFAELGYTLRSGAADGADTAFEIGADYQNGRKEIYLPWRGFNGNDSPHFNISPEALRISGEIYGERWERTRSSVKCLMSRNIYQVLGLTLDTPSSFMLCWTPDGVITHTERTRSTGGTGQAIACASLNQIPVFNLKNNGEEERLLDFIGGLDE